jgi:hypothetical protein
MERQTYDHQPARRQAAAAIGAAGRVAPDHPSPAASTRRISWRSARRSAGIAARRAWTGRCSSASIHMPSLAPLWPPRWKRSPPTGWTRSSTSTTTTRRPRSSRTPSWPIAGRSWVPGSGRAISPSRTCRSGWRHCRATPRMASARPPFRCKFVAPGRRGPSNPLLHEPLRRGEIRFERSVRPRHSNRIASRSL